MTDLESQDPKSRIYPLGTGALPPGMSQFDYMGLAYDCRLTKRMLHVLGYLAFRYNFLENRPASMGQRRASNDLHMTRQTFADGIAELVAYGWVIQIKSDDYNDADNYELLIGNECPDVKWKDSIAKKTQLIREKKKAERKKNKRKTLTSGGTYLAQ
jgi:hypothetical protein